MMYSKRKWNMTPFVFVLRLLETRNGWYIKKWVIYYVRWMILSLNLQSVYYSVIYFLLYWFDSIYIERNCLVGAAKPPHIHWPAFLKLKIETWERIWISKMGPICVKIERGERGEREEVKYFAFSDFFDFLIILLQKNHCDFANYIRFRLFSSFAM